MVSDIEIVDLQGQPALLIRTHSSVQQLGKVLGSSFAAIRDYLGGLGEKPAGPTFAAYYNQEMANLDVGIGIPVSEPLTGKGEIQSGEIPAGKYARCLYTGKHSKLQEAYAALDQLMQANHVTATAEAYELYLNDTSTAAPDELQTIVMLLLKTG